MQDRIYELAVVILIFKQLHTILFMNLIIVDVRQSSELKIFHSLNFLNFFYVFESSLVRYFAKKKKKIKEKKKEIENHVTWPLVKKRIKRVLITAFPILFHLWTYVHWVGCCLLNFHIFKIYWRLTKSLSFKSVI